MQIELKIPESWINVCCSKRVLINKYQTNTFIKCIGTYCYLKSISNSGSIHNFNYQKKNFYNDLNISKNSFDTIVNNCIKIGLMNLQDNNLHLNSYADISKLLGVKTGKKIKFIFDNENNVKIHDTLNTLNLSISQTKQQKAIINRIKANSYLKNELMSILNNADFNNTKLLLDQLFNLQINEFKTGTKNSLLFAFRFDYNNTLAYLKKLFNTKSTLTITYLKRKLERLNLISIEKLGGIISEAGNRARDINKNLVCNYNRSINKPVWFLNDRLHLNLQVTNNF